MFSSYSIVRRSFFFPRLSLFPPFLPLVLFSASFRSQSPTMTDFRITDIVVQDMQDTWWLDKLVRISKADLKPLVDATLRGRVESYLQPWLQSEVIIFLMTLNAFGGVLSGSMVLAMMIPTIRPYVTTWTYILHWTLTNLWWSILFSFKVCPFPYPELPLHLTRS